jgi:NADPH:quinone reductase-like Zn-dependent oxidoreductase
VYAVQLAAALGATVTATGRPAYAEAVRELGAARFIDITTENFDDVLSDVDVVVDTVGGDTLARSYAVLRAGGRLITVAEPPDSELAARHQVEAAYFIVQPDRDELQRLAALVDGGRLRPVVAATYPLADGRSAYAGGSQPRKPGKTVLLVRPD